MNIVKIDFDEDGRKVYQKNQADIENEMKNCVDDIKTHTHIDSPQ